MFWTLLQDKYYATEYKTKVTIDQWRIIMFENTSIQRTEVSAEDLAGWKKWKEPHLYYS